MNNIILGKDIPFENIDGRLLKLIDFIPKEKSFFNPYAFATVGSTVFKGDATLPVFHRTDFKNLSDAWRIKKEDEEILIFWSKQHYSSKLFKLFSPIFPRLWIRICPKNSYKIESDDTFIPDLQGEARFIATKAIREWKPSAMD